jgi:cytochrome c-type biogenesis protein CcmH/NrfG
VNRSLSLALAVAALALACKRADDAPPQPMATVPAQGAPGTMPPPGAGAPPSVPGMGMGQPAVPDARRIAALEGLVAREPANREAWVQLGNDYFDSKQAQKAVAAYGRALELKGDDANVLTDQGVMYREMGQYDKAIANFEKAAKIDPQHVQSTFNLGVVYAYDLKLPAKAVQAWNKVIQTSPGSPQAAQARQAIQELGPQAR